MNFLGFTSSEFFSNIKIDKVSITDIFIQEKYIFIIVNFIYILIIDSDSLTVILNSYENKSSTILNLNQIFKGEYNKTLCLIWKSTEDERSRSMFNDFEFDTSLDYNFLYLYSKKGMKCLKINIEHLIENPIQHSSALYSIKKINSSLPLKFIDYIQILDMSTISKSI